MPSKLSRYCEAVIEAGWLGALILTPLFFNVYSARVFEPDKLTLLRSIALVMIAAWVTKVVDGQEWKQLDKKTWWRFPMVLPVTVLALIYLLTTAFSVTPRVSLLGSYQRLQGTYTTLSYIVVFAMMLVHLRSKAQVNRLITTAIIVSVPISLYGLLQRYGLDPLPWGGDVTRRIASNMGNAIFVSAYIIMIFPLVIGRIIESFTAILTDEELSWADVIRASIYIFIAAIHMLAILFSQSRGPLLGFLAGLFTLILILLVHLRDKDLVKGRIKGKEILLAIGSLLVMDLVGFGLGYLLGLAATNQGWISIESTKLSAEAYQAAMLGGLGFLGAVVSGVVGIFLLVATRKGWRWLWLSLILQAALVGSFLIMFNIPDSPIADWRNLPYIGRIGTALDLQANTAKVRTYIWQGAVEMISPHEPLEFPDGDTDPLNSIRPLIGYGPESMYVAYNRFYPPELAHVEKRNASPDRSHNETFDALVITGFMGFVAWQAFYGSLFYLGFRWLGVIHSKRDKSLFVLLVLGAGLISALVFWRWQGTELIGVAFPFGELAGLLAYIVYYALFSPSAKKKEQKLNYILLTTLLTASIAHFAEIHFGIAIAATRIYFFAYAALAVIVGYIIPQANLAQTANTAASPQADNLADDKTQRHRKRRRSVSTPTVSSSRPSWIKPILAGGIIMGLVLGTLGYEFISVARSDDQELPSTGQIFWNSLTKDPGNDFANTYAILGLIGLTTLMGCGLVVSEAVKENPPGRSSTNPLHAIGVYLGTSVFIGLVFSFVQAGQLRFLISGAGAKQETSILDRIRMASDATAGLLTMFYLFVFVLMLGLAVALVHGRKSARKSSPSLGTWITLAVGAIVAIVLINTTNLRVIQADIVYKQADPWDKRALRERNPAVWDLAISVYNHSLELAPLEDYYYLFLGRAYLEKSSVLDDPVGQQRLLEEARDKLLQARQINPLNTDHSANLARLHTRWAELAPSDVERTTKANQANEYYQQANSLSPQNAVIINEWARLTAHLFNDCEGGLAKLDQSLAIDDIYQATYESKGQVALVCGDRARQNEQQELRTTYYKIAEETYKTLIELNNCHLQAHTALGYAQSQLGKREQAIQTNLNGLTCVANPNSAQTLQFHHNLAILYQETGDLESAVIHAQSAAQASGNNIANLLNAANLLLQLGEAEPTYGVAQRIGSLEPQNWNQLTQLAEIFRRIGAPAEALTYAQQALELAPENKKAEVQNLIANISGQETP